MHLWRLRREDNGAPEPVRLPKVRSPRRGLPVGQGSGARTRLACPVRLSQGPVPCSRQNPVHADRNRRPAENADRVWRRYLPSWRSREYSFLEEWLRLRRGGSEPPNQDTQGV